MRCLFQKLVATWQVFSSSFTFLSQSFGIPARCKYPETCSHYALRKLETEKSIFQALARITHRVISCGPLFRYMEVKD